MPRPLVPRFVGSMSDPFTQGVRRVDWPRHLLRSCASTGATRKDFLNLCLEGQACVAVRSRMYCVIRKRTPPLESGKSTHRRG